MLTVWGMEQPSLSHGWNLGPLGIGCGGEWGEARETCIEPGHLEKDFQRKMMSVIWGMKLVEFEMFEAAKWRGCTDGWKCGSEALRGGSSKGTR